MPFDVFVDTGKTLCRILDGDAAQSTSDVPLAFSATRKPMQNAVNAVGALSSLGSTESRGRDTLNFFRRGFFCQFCRLCRPAVQNPPIRQDWTAWTALFGKNTRVEKRLYRRMMPTRFLKIRGSGANMTRKPLKLCPKPDHRPSLTEASR